ncbi:MAG TPA: group III truncated hemoglobin [Roseococcus sp.]|jgi:hemoglobin|nr:group III truncated hemoglobin [Roseococcus sp.]
MQPVPLVTEAGIARLVDAFYRRVRADPVLAPVFHAALGEEVGEWEAHEEKLCRFWSSLMRRSGAYHGDPYGAHLRLPGLTPAMFDRWLALFGETCAAECPPEVAAAFMERAARIARSLRMGIFERPL